MINDEEKNITDANPITSAVAQPDDYGSFNNPGRPAKNTDHTSTYRHAFNESLFRAAPYIGSQIIMITADTLSVVMLANVSDDALAASNIISSMSDWILATAGACFNSTSNLVAKKIGEGKADEFNQVGIILRQSWRIAVVLSIPGVIIAFNCKPILAALDQPDKVVDLVSDYFFIYAAAMPGKIMLSASRKFTLASGHTSAGFVIDFVSRVFNLGFAYPLIFGKFGMPELGIKGLAIANVATTVLTLSGSTLYFCKSVKFKNYKIQSFKLLEQMSFYKELWQIGWPIALRVGMELGVTLATSFIIGSLGTVQLAADEAAFQFVYIVSTPMYSLMDTTNALVSKALAENKYAYTQKLVNADLIIGLGITLTALILFLSIPKQLLGIFVDNNSKENNDILEIAKTLLFINGFSQIFDTIRNIYSGGLTGYKDSLTPTLISIFTTLVINIPLAVSLTYAADLKAKGTLIARGAGIATGSALMAGFWYKKYRSSYLSIQNPVAEPPNANVERQIVEVQAETSSPRLRNAN